MWGKGLVVHPDIQKADWEREVYHHVSDEVSLSSSLSHLGPLPLLVGCRGTWKSPNAPRLCDGRELRMLCRTAASAPMATHLLLASTGNVRAPPGGSTASHHFRRHLQY